MRVNHSKADPRTLSPRLSTEMALHCILLAIPGLALANSERIERPMPAIVRDVAKTLGFDEGNLTSVWDGEIVSRSLDTRSDKELTIVVMMRLSEKHPDFYERTRTDMACSRSLELWTHEDSDLSRFS